MNSNIKLLMRDTKFEIQALKRVEQNSKNSIENIEKKVKKYKFLYELPLFLSKILFRLVQLFSKRLFFLIDLHDTEYKKYSERKKKADEIIEMNVFREKVAPFLKGKANDIDVLAKTIIRLIVPLVQNKQLLIPLDSKLLAMIAFKIYKKQN